MQTYSYQAIGMSRGATRQVQRGEISAETAEDARALLRQVGLTTLELKAIAAETGHGLLADLRAERQRRRRTSRKSELLDSLAVLLDAGIPLAESLAVLEGNGWQQRGGSAHRLLVHVRDAVRSGGSLAEALGEQPRWFDGAEVAMIRSGEHSGELPAILRRLAEHHRRRDELAGRLVMALTYPSIVLLAGIGVVVFLSTQTLPNLVSVLEGGGIDPPALTLGAIWLGEAMLRLGWLVPVLAAFGFLLARASRARAARPAPGASGRIARLFPGALRSTALARAMEGLAGLLRAGVPLVESLRVLAPTLSGPGGPQMRAALHAAAERIERGDNFADALGDDPWIDGECRKLIEVGEEAGELAPALSRLAERYQRRARRQIERLLAVLEPAVILALAALVGLVVMAAVLPMLRLQQLL